MKRLPLLALATVAAILLSNSAAHATLSAYQFGVSNGSAITPTEWTTVWQGGFPGARSTFGWQSATIDLPFGFTFDCTEYSQISLSSFGLIGFGSYVYTDWYNYMDWVGGPVLAPFWDNIWIGGGAPGNCNYRPEVRYGVTGSPGARIFVIDYWKVTRGACDWCQSGPMVMDFQVRLYEGSNKIEFHYANASPNWPSCISNRWGTGTTNTSASIGIATSSWDFISVTPNGSTAYEDRGWFNNYVDLVYSSISSNTIYSFTPPSTSYLPDLAQGGVSNMASGATLMRNISVQRGSSGTFQPFQISLPEAACWPLDLSASISGPNAGDYSVSPTSATLYQGGLQPFDITFTPQSVGERVATLTINDQFGINRSYTLRATGAPRISWTPDIAQGGTPTLTSGDTLMKDFVVRRRVPRDFTPMTLQNFSTNGAAPPAVITLSIDSAGGPSTQYSLVSPSSVSLGPGQSHTPIIRFLGTGLDEQHATLTVNADGEIRVFPLKAISGTPSIRVTTVGQPVDPANPIFHQVYSCVGEVATSIPLDVANPGQFPLVISGIDVYAIDTTERQGTPIFPLVRDARGRLVPVYDYILTSAPGTAPLSANTRIGLPFSIEPGQTRTVYMTFVGQIPGRRFGRAYLRTNAENILGTDTTLDGAPDAVLGLLSFDVIGRSIGSSLAANASGLALKPLVFPGTRVGDTSVASFTVANTGACDMRINRRRLRVDAGDVNEFRLLSALGNAALDPATDDYILPPGMTDTITVRFTPSRAGTRMATLRIQTNDSTIVRPGLAERGSYYLDLSGRALAGLDAQDLVLSPVVIGRSVAGTAVLENSLNTPVVVTSIALDGDDAAEFSEDAAMPWPARPLTVLAGEKLLLSVRLTPVGSAGARRTTLVLVTSTGDSVRVAVRGEAGTQSLVVSPTSLFEDVTIVAGQSRHSQVMISNDGTLPVKVTSIRIVGADSMSYRAGVMPRRDLDAGQTEYLELTYAPTNAGQTSADLLVTASNGQTYTVALRGTALKIRRDPIDPATTAAPTDPGAPDARDEGSTAYRRPSLR